MLSVFLLSKAGRRWLLLSRLPCLNMSLSCLLLLLWGRLFLSFPLLPCFLWFAPFLSHLPANPTLWFSPIPCLSPHWGLPVFLSLLGSSQLGYLSLFSTSVSEWQNMQPWSPHGYRVRLEFWSFCSELGLYSEHPGGERGQQCVLHLMGPFFPCQQRASGSRTVGFMAHPLGLIVLSTRLSFQGQWQGSEQGRDTEMTRPLSEGYRKKTWAWRKDLWLSSYVISG